MSHATPAPTDAIASARAAGLRYVYDSKPGITRHRSGKTFRYITPEGKPLRDPETLAHIKSIVIPPAWTDVWISPTPNGHLQATGRDARGRKQSRYHPDWRTTRDQAKYEHMLHFGKALPAIRQRVAHDLALPGLPREKVLATIVRLMETTYIRVGNETYARENHSYGLTTLRRRHVTIDGARLTFNFKGKSGVVHTINLTDRRLPASSKPATTPPATSSSTTSITTATPTPSPPPTSTPTSTPSPHPTPTSPPRTSAPGPARSWPAPSSAPVKPATNPPRRNSRKTSLKPSSKSPTN
jgi:DNA topoisomerase IB